MSELDGVEVADFTAEGLAAAVRELLRDPERRAVLGAAGARLVRERFSADAMVSAYEQRYAPCSPLPSRTSAAHRAPRDHKQAPLRRHGRRHVDGGLRAALALVTPPRYEATATLAMTPKINENQALIGAGDLSALLSTYAETAKSRVNRARAQQILGRPLPGEVDTSTVGGTGILRITGKAATPQDAADTANAAAQALPAVAPGQPAVRRQRDRPAGAADVRRPAAPPLIVAVGILLGLLAGVSYALGDGARAPPDRDPGRDQRAHRQAGRRPAAAPARAPACPRLARVDQERMIGLQESYRALRTNVQFLAEGKRVIEVTSPDPAQGKSTVVANLGTALAQIGVETVIVDADLRRPTQHKVFGVDNSTGLSTMLSVRACRDRLKPSGFPNLSVIRAARCRPIRPRCCTCASRA